jgi:hypothetical protein
VTFSATVTSGRTIDWYTAASGGSLVSGGNGVTSFAPTLTTTTTYYAQARITSTQCVSATRLAVTGTVKTRPTITLTSGNASQTVKQYSAITPTTYAADATVLRGGILPNGVTDSGASASSITISGTPTEAGTYNYSILAIGSNSCPNAMNGTLTVIPVFYSSSTWSFGGVTWSDVLVVQPPYCTQVTTLTSYQNATPPAEYVIKTVDGTDYYYYNWPCVLTLCDSPWHMPSEAHYLFAFFAPANNPIVGQWGTAGHASGNRVYGYGYFGAYATCSPGTGPDRQTNVANYADDSWVSGDEYRANAHQVRCIKD